MKTKLFSVTRSDFDWQFFCGSGPGGQNKNKRATACRCIHRASGATAESRVYRTQGENRTAAFNACVKSKKFKDWVRIQSAAMAAGFADAEKMVDKMMAPEFIREETYAP